MQHSGHEDIWNSVSHLLPAWTWECDANYCLTGLHTQFNKLHGIDPRELMGLCILDGAGDSETYEEAGLAHYLTLLRNKEVIDGFCYERLLIHGERAVLMDSAVPRFDGDGVFTGYVGISMNLSEVLRGADHSDSLVGALQVRAEDLSAKLSERNQALETSNALLTDILDAMGEGLMVTTAKELTDPENRIAMVNPAYRDLFGFDEDTPLTGMKLSDYIALLIARGDGLDKATSEGFEAVNRKLNNGDPVTMKVPSQNRHYMCRARPTESGGLVLVHNDITALQAAAEDLRDARNEALAASNAKSRFLANMSHEIRTPMNGVIGAAELLTQESLTASQLHLVETLKSSAQSLVDLIGEILDFTKIEVGRIELDTAPVCLVTLLREVCTLLSPIATNKSISLTLETTGLSQRAYDVDATRLKQILVNVVGNALKFTQKGSVVVRASGEGPVTLHVQDTGMGIPPDKISGIFSAFEQAQGGLQRQFEGTGLGLAISKQLVDLMGGTIEVSSELGRGTLFTISLPLTPSAAKQDTTAQVPPVAGPIPTGLRVLVAEDNRTNQFIVGKYLEKLKARPTMVANGRLAVAAVAQDRFDLVLMDLSMPVMDGLSAARAIRQTEERGKWPHVPIIALTGNAFESDRAQALDAGMNAFLTKPLQQDALRRAIAEVMADHPAVRAVLS